MVNKMATTLLASFLIIVATASKDLLLLIGFCLIITSTITSFVAFPIFLREVFFKWLITKIF